MICTRCNGRFAPHTTAGQVKCTRCGSVAMAAAVRTEGRE